MSSRVHKGEYAASPSQERFFALEAMPGGRGVHHVPLAFWLRGQLDVARLEEALQSVLERHAVLRSRFVSSTRLSIDPTPHVSLRVRDYESESQLVADFGRRALEPFELTVGPLFRFHLGCAASAPGSPRALLAVFHHAVFDGRSAGVFERDLARAYGEGSSAPLPASFMQFALDEQTQRSSEGAALELAALAERLEPFAREPLELPGTRPRPSVRDTRGFVVQHELAGELLDRLEARLRPRGATLYHATLSTAASLLAEWSGREHFLVGSMVDGRRDSAFEGTVGPFANTIVLPFDLPHGADPIATLELARSESLTAFETRGFGIEALVRHLGIAPDPGRTPLFAHMVLLDDRRGPGLAPTWPPELRVETFELAGGVARTDLCLWLHHPGIGPEAAPGADSASPGLYAEASGALFQRAVVAKRLARWEEILRELADRLEHSGGDRPGRVFEGRHGGGSEQRPRAAERVEMRGASIVDAASQRPPSMGPTTKTTTLLARLSDAGIRLSLDGPELVVQAPRDALTAELRDLLRGHKEALVALLREGDSGAEKDVANGLAQPRPEGPLSLSLGQERLWVLSRLEPDSTAYHMPIAWKLDGPLDIVAFERAFGKVIERHEILRTRYVHEAGRPCQVIEGADSVRLEIVPGDWNEAAVRSELSARAKEPFDLEARPPVRPALFGLGGNTHVFSLLVHHIAFDGWSAERFLRELCAFYAEAQGGEPAKLEPLACQFADWARFQRDELSGERYDKLFEDWRAELAGGLPQLELPTDHPRPAVQSYHGANSSRELSPALVESMRALARSEGATSYMFLLAAAQALLARYGNAEVVPLGTVVAGRERRELDPLIGFFANTLVLRGDLSGDPGFRELLARVKRSTLFALDNQSMPFERLVEELAPERDLSRTPLFQVLVMIEDASGRGARLGDVEASLFELDTDVARTDLMITGHDAPEGFSLWAEYSTQLFEAASIERLLAHLENLIAAVVADPDRPLSEIALLTPSERDAILRTSSSEREAAPFVAVHRTIEKVAREHADTEAVRVAGPDGLGAGLDYAGLESFAERVAAALRARGIGPGDRVGLALPRSERLPAVVLGVWKAGAAYVPLDPGFPADRLRYMAEDAGLELCLVEGDVPDLGAQTKRLALDELPAEFAVQPACEPQPTDTAYVIYTSGSTGRPKGVEVPHGAVANFLTAMVNEPGLARGESLLAVTTLSFDISVLELFAPLVAGGTVWIAPREVTQDGLKLLGTLETCRPDVMQATPASWSLLLRAGWKGDGKLRILAGGEALPRELADGLLERGSELWNMYGPTETTVWSSVARVEAEGPITIGEPIDGTQVYVLDRHLEPVPPGVAGELWIGGDGVASGYLGRPELTAERFLEDPFRAGGRIYRTGDLARRRADGRLEHLGRIDSQVKLRGFRIELGEIESILAEHPSVVACACTVHQAASSGGDGELVAWMVTVEGEEPDDPGRLLRERLPAYMVPTLFRTLPELPQTPNAKVDRLALSKLPLGEREVVRTGRAPGAGLESDVAKVWSEVLALEFVPADASFFDLGGHSLSLVELQVRLQNNLGRELSVVDLFQHPTVASLTEFLTESGAPELHPSDTERGRLLSAGRRALMQRRRTRK